MAKTKHYSVKTQYCSLSIIYFRL